MIVCTSCGAQNEDGESFCGDCGAYLEWEGERVGPAAPAAAVPPAPPAPAAGPGFVQRVKQAVGLGETGPAAGPGAPTAAQTAAPPPVAAATTAPPAAPAVGAPAWAPPPPPGAVPAAPPAGVAAPPAGVASTQAAPPQQPGASALVVPLAATAPADAAPPARRPAAAAATAPVAAPAAPAAAPVQPAAGQPAAVRPGEAAPKPRRRDLPPEDRPPAPGETICGSCGAGNAPSRKFCRRCGAGLADMPVAKRPPWWRRIFVRGPAAPTAGDRPRVKRRRTHGKLWTTLAVIVVLVVAGYFTRPYWTGALNEVIDRVKGTHEVNPSAFSASSAAPGHPARFVRDGATNNYWAPAGRPAGQWVQAGFAGPFRLVYLRVFNGAADALEAFLAAPSLQQITVTYFRKGAKTVTRDYTLRDKPGQQQFHVALDDVVAVRVTIRSIYRPAAGPLAALGELEFLARS